MKRNILGVVIFIMTSVVTLIFLAIIDYSFFIVFVNISTIFLGLIIYVIAFYSREYSKGSNLLFVGVAYLSVSIIDLMFIVNGSGFIVGEYDLNISIHLWMGARFTEAFVLYFAYSHVMKKNITDIKLIIASFGLTTLGVFAVVLASDYLPTIYDIDTGYTLYKQFLDLMIILLFVVALVSIYRNESRYFNKRVLIYAISFKIFGEFVFIFDTGEENLLGTLRYVSKYISYVLLFLVFARDLLQRPYQNIFKAFKEKEEELTELSKKDSLTGLYNHSTSYEIMREIIKENGKIKKDFCLMMIDVDDFKCINDKYGHVKGDEILVEIANVFKNCDGPLKLAGRYGGDEFVVLFTDCDRIKAKKIAKKIFIKMDELSEDIDIKVTLSIGIAEWKNGFTAKDLVKSADYQMYEAKSIGKNTFSIKEKSE